MFFSLCTQFLNCSKQFLQKKSQSVSVSLIRFWHRAHVRLQHYAEGTHQPTPAPVMPTHAHALTNSHHMPACMPELVLIDIQLSMSQNHKEEKVILFNYESHTCIIDGLSVFSVIAEKEDGVEGSVQCVPPISSSCCVK